MIQVIQVLPECVIPTAAEGLGNHRPALRSRRCRFNQKGRSTLVWMPWSKSLAQAVPSGLSAGRCRPKQTAADWARIGSHQLRRGSLGSQGPGGQIGRRSWIVPTRLARSYCADGLTPGTTGGFWRRGTQGNADFIPTCAACSSRPGLAAGFLACAGYCFRRKAHRRFKEDAVGVTPQRGHRTASADPSPVRLDQRVMCVSSTCAIAGSGDCSFQLVCFPRRPRAGRLLCCMITFPQKPFDT